MQWPKRIVIFYICHVTQADLSTGFVAKTVISKYWKQELTVKTLAQCTQKETETCNMCLFESQILFYHRAGTAGVNGINALD